jgi:hypothetical protein
MNALIRSNLPPHNRHPIKRVVGLFTTKKLAISQHGDVEKTPLQVDSSSPEKDRYKIGAAMRNEKIENARSIANAVRQLFTTKKLVISQHGDAKKTPPQVDSSSPEKAGNNTGAAMRNEKIEIACAIAHAVRQQRQQQTSASTSTVDNDLLERLEAKLQAKSTLQNEKIENAPSIANAVIQQHRFSLALNRQKSLAWEKVTCSKS